MCSTLTSLSTCCSFLVEVKKRSSFASNKKIYINDMIYPEVKALADHIFSVYIFAYSGRTAFCFLVSLISKNRKLDGYIKHSKHNLCGVIISAREPLTFVGGYMHVGVRSLESPMMLILFINWKQEICQ